jgi:hypothetical protein
MAKFKLFLVSREASAQWHLEPNTTGAYRDASARLRDDWIDGIQALQNRREVFIFRRDKAPIAAVLKSLREAGIPEEEVTVVIVEIWPCKKCGKTWEILCEPLPQGGGPAQFGNYDFRCPNGCREEFPKTSDETIMPGLSFRPLMYRENGTAAWHEIRVASVG